MIFTFNALIYGSEAKKCLDPSGFTKRDQVQPSEKSLVTQSSTPHRNEQCKEIQKLLGDDYILADVEVLWINLFRAAKDRSIGSISESCNHKQSKIWVFPKIVVPQIIHLFIGFSIEINHPFWGVIPLFLVQHPYIPAVEGNTASAGVARSGR